MTRALPWTALAMLVAGRADATTCLALSDLTVTVNGNSVSACAFGAGSCWAPLVRQDVATGAVVSLDHCADAGGSVRFCVVDECVPPGIYRYGPTDGTCGGSEAPCFVPVLVTSPLATDCMWSTGVVGAMSTDAGAPWGGDGTIERPCLGPTCGGCFGNSTADGPARLLDLGLVLLGVLLLKQGRRRT